jgi:predicted TIM-barrel fold metal-dependent hydrolase
MPISSGGAMDNDEMPFSFDSFSKVPILDGHIHVWQGCQTDLIWQAMEREGAQRCNALSLFHLDGRGTLNEEVLQFKAASHGRAYAFGALDYSAYTAWPKPSDGDLAAQAARLKDLGLDGVKMWEGKPSVYIHLPDRLEGPLYAPYFAWMEANEFPILLHLADAPRFWDPARVGLDPWSFAGEEYPSRQEMYAELERILVRHPRLRMILAHFLFLWAELPEAARILDAYPSICFDLAPGVEGFVHLSRDPEAARRFFLRYQDQIIYGTDVGAVPVMDPRVPFRVDREVSQPWLIRTFLETEWDIPFPSDVGLIGSQFSGKRLRGIGLPAEVLEKIYWRNFARFAGPNPRESEPAKNGR